MAPSAPPDFDRLLPPLLAHLPAAYTSPQPPPSLFPLLAPILRQRVKLLSSEPSDTWLSLLTWSPSHANDLSTHMSTHDFSPHPCSGEIEVGFTEFHGLRRVDEETLKASVELSELGIVVEYVWVDQDKDDGEEDAWKIIDVHTAAGGKEEHWYSRIEAAEEAFTLERLSPGAPNKTSAVSSAADDAGENDDYWNMYDNRSSAQTPAVCHADVPTEESYFERYYGDREQAEEDKEAESSLEMSTRFQTSTAKSSGTGASLASTPPTAFSTESNHVHESPRPRSSDSHAQQKIAKMEEDASRTIDSGVAVKQHIATSLKSLYRLSQATGMDRAEFVDIIETELSVLSMLDGENA